MSRHKNITDKFIHVVEKCILIGIDISKMTTTDTILTLAVKSQIRIDKLRELTLEVGLDPDYKIGQVKSQITQAYRGNNICIPPTKEQVLILKELGINLEKKNENTIENFIKITEKLSLKGIDVSKMSSSDTIETLAKKSEVSKKDIENIAQELKLDVAYQIGWLKNGIVQACSGNGTMKPPTEAQIQKLHKLGIDINIKTMQSKEKKQYKKERDTIDEFIEELKKLNANGIDASKMTQRDTIESLAKKSGLTTEEIEKIAKKEGLMLYEKIGQTKKHIINAHRHMGSMKPPTEEQIQKMAELGVSLEYTRKKVTTEEIAKATINVITNVELTDKEQAILTNLIEKENERI